MNAKELYLKRKATWCKYHIINTTPIHRVKQNVVFLHVTNTLKHELVKSEVCYWLKKAGHYFITECERNREKIIVDVVDLDLDQEIEIVHSHDDKVVLERYKNEGVIAVFSDQPVKEQLESNGVI